MALLPDKQIIKVMENQKQTIDNLMNAMFDYMRDIHRSEGTIFRYRRRWLKVKDFMADKSNQLLRCRRGKDIYDFSTWFL